MANPILNGGYASPQSVFSTYSTPAHMVGSQGYLGDRKFRYVKFTDGTAIGPNKLAQSPAPSANHVSETGTLTGTTAAIIEGNNTLTAVLGATACHQDRYRDGYLKIESATTGAGQMFKLGGHAFVASAGTLTAQTPDPVVTATSGTTTWSFVENCWSNVVIHPTTGTASAAGVVLVNFAAAATASTATENYVQTAASTWTQVQYGWIQTGGLASCLIDTGNVVAGSRLKPSTATAGALTVAVETDILDPIAVAVEALSTDNAYATVFLRID